MSKIRSLKIDGNRIRARRLELGWTQQELATRSGYCERLIRKAERGECLSEAASRVLAETLSDDDYVFTFGEVCCSERQAIDWVCKELFGRNRSYQSDASSIDLASFISATIAIECLVGSPETPFGCDTAGVEEMLNWISTFRGHTFTVSEQETGASVFILDGSQGYLFEKVKLVSGVVASSLVPIHCNLQFEDGLLCLLRVHANAAGIASFYKRLARGGMNLPRICHA